MPEPTLTNTSATTPGTSNPIAPAANPGLPSTSRESGQPLSQPNLDQPGDSGTGEQAPAQQAAQILTPDNILAEYEASLTGSPLSTPGQSQSQSQSQSQGQGQGQQPKQGRSLNSKRKFDGLSEEESWLFNDMSTEAYNRLYPAYLKSKEHESEIEKLRGQLSQQQESSFFDQEGAWQITPEYRDYSSNLSSLQSQRDFWKGQLSTLNATLAKAQQVAAKEEKTLEEVLQGVTIDCIVNDGKGNESLKAFPVSYQLQADIMNELNVTSSYIVDVQNKINNIETSFQGKHKDYLKNLTGIEEQIFKGFPTEKLDKQSVKKLEQFPAYVRSKPEVKLLAKAWVLFDALIYALNKNRGLDISNNIRNGTVANNGGAIQQGGAAGGNGANNSVSNILDRFKSAGIAPR